MEQKTTFCRICEAQCGLKVSIENNRIVEILPDEEHVVSKGYACIKGLSFEDFRTSPDRLTHPLKKVNGEFVEISWQQAFDEIGAKVKQLRKDFGDDSVGLYFGNPISFSLLYPLFINGFVRGLNTQKFFNTGTLDCNNKFYVAEKMYGAAMALTFPDVDRNQFLMIIGGNPAISKMSFINLPHPMKRIKAIEERGGRVVHINPRKTESAIQAGEHFFIRPDTDVYFLLSFLNEVLQRDAIDKNKIKQHMKGLEHLLAIAKPWPAEKTAPITGISAEILKDLVDSYLKANGAALYLSTGVNQGSNGTLAFWVMEVINAITGNLDKLGGVQMGDGIISYAELLAKTPSREVHSRIGNTTGFLEAIPSGLMADEILTPGEGQTKAMFVISGNPVITATNSEKLSKAFNELELMVSIEIVRNETANHADYILPGTHFAERPDLPFMFQTFCGTTPTPWFQFTDALVKSPEGVKDELWQLTKLANACNAPLFGSRIFQMIVNTGGFLRKLPLIGSALKPMPYVLLNLISFFGKQGGIKKLAQHKHGVLLEPLKENNYLGKRIVTPDKKIDLAPDVLVKLAAERLEKSFDKHTKELSSLRLITKRERFSHNSWSHNHKKYISKDRHTNYLYINPIDANERLLQNGDSASVSSASGSVIVPIKLDDNMMPGAVALPHGWGHEKADGLSIAKTVPGVNVNILALDGPDSIEPLSGMAQFNGINVEVVKVG